MRLRCLLLLSLLVSLLGACARVPPAITPVRIGSDAPLELAGMGRCGPASPDEPARGELALDPKRPLVILVHGCNAREQDFGVLARIFALHDQQSVCFRYDDRDRLSSSATRLRHNIERLANRLENPDVLVLGHSQGGLVARAALADREDDRMRLREGRYRLVTVSSPFGGIRAASHCGSIPYHIASLGVTVAICRGISGAKWNEIHPRARMVQEPARLDPSIREHLTIVTDERDTCRRYSPDGLRCLQDDFVFTLDEQHNRRMERDQRVVKAPIAAGHIEVVGAHGNEPRKLLKVLQHNGVLRPTRPDEQIVVEQLVAKHGW